MSDTNYITSIVKILETPKQSFLKNNILFTKFRVQFPQIRGSKSINLIFWGNLSRDIVKYYKINDYIIVEGYVSLQNKQALKIKNKISKKVTITALRAYPFLLSYNCSSF